jgi:hypothetical protein
MPKYRHDQPQETKDEQHGSDKKTGINSRAPTDKQCLFPIWEALCYSLL